MKNPINMHRWDNLQDERPENSRMNVLIDDFEYGATSQFADNYER